ncbi:MAG TPA: deoxyguanosinetriphosphate triphosphohydrolase [Clostridiales bacterium]|nr:deoxyguanosinetriphosphate triphosphohydrolase [Clostridiales bacterium]
MEQPYTIREQLEQREHLILSPFATFSDRSKGRVKEETSCPMRTCFQRDRDRIIHSKAFRRLKHKTQVFLAPDGDHYRTRLTHTLEVAQIARTVARALSLNEDLTEAIALGHDLGHTPFGHAGERALAEITGRPFRHNENSLRIVDVLEKRGKGLNLTAEVRDGILCHTGERNASTPEGRLVRLSDRIAYISHDIDDAIRGGVLSEWDIPAEYRSVLGVSTSKRINFLVGDLIANSRPEGTEFLISLSPEADKAMMGLRSFLFENVYTNPVAKGEERKAEVLLIQLYCYYEKNVDKLPNLYLERLASDELSVVLCDFIAGMSDRYAVELFKELFTPKSWQVL